MGLNWACKGLSVILGEEVAGMEHWRMKPVGDPRELLATLLRRFHNWDS